MRRLIPLSYVYAKYEVGAKLSSLHLRHQYTTELRYEMLISTKSTNCPFSFRQYLYFKPEDPRGGVEAVGVEDEILSAQVELRRPVTEGPGGEAGSPVRHQVQRHVAGTCTGQEGARN